MCVPQLWGLDSKGRVTLSEEGYTLEPLVGPCKAMSSSDQTNDSSQLSVLIRKHTYTSHHNYAALRVHQ